MFGESESESPRAGSPWDTFLLDVKSPPLDLEVKPAYTSVDFPKLVPEVEEVLYHINLSISQ